MRAAVSEKGGGRADEQGLLFEYTLKFLVLAGFLELILYRLASRLGMHLSKLAAKYEAIRLFFKGLSSVGLTLLNVVSLLIFLALAVLLFNKLKDKGKSRCEILLISLMGLLLILTGAFLALELLARPPAMIGSIVYNIVTIVILGILTIEYFGAHHRWSQRVMVGCYLLGIFGWLYYQTVSTAFGLVGSVSVPPLVHEINRIGEAMMVLASILVLWAYGGLSFTTSNRRQRRRLVLFTCVGAVVFLALLFLDFFLGLYDRGLAEEIRKAGEGIGWIFQMGMGYTFYLPFVLYVAGLLGWGYTVVKQITMGRMAGYGLALMFMAGYALQLSHLTLMVLLGLMLLNLDKRRATVTVGGTLTERPLAGAAVQ